MSWIKLDDQWMDHPKVVAAGRDARDMWLASLTYCAKHLTDGYFHANLIPSLAVMAGVDVANCQSFASVLIEVGLWESKDGLYHVHDYLEYNPSKEQSIATREARKSAGSAGGRAKASKMPSKMLPNEQQNSAPSPSPSPSKEKEKEINDDGFLARFLKITRLGISDVTVLNELEDLEKSHPQHFWDALMWASGTKPMPSDARKYARMLGTALPGWKPKQNGKSNGNGNNHAGKTRRVLTGANGEQIEVWE